MVPYNHPAYVIWGEESLANARKNCPQPHVDKNQIKINKIGGRVGVVGGSRRK